MYTSENQKVVTVRKAVCDNKNKDNVYGVVNKRCMFHAMNELTYNEFKIYMFFATNQDNNEWALSTKYLSETVGANKRKIQDCINSLIEKGYLRQVKGNQYNFNEEYENSIGVSKKDIGVSKKDIGVCPKRTQGVSQKDTGGMSQKDTQIIQLNNTKNNTMNNTIDASLESASPKSINQSSSLTLGSLTQEKIDSIIDVFTSSSRGTSYDEMMKQLNFSVTKKQMFDIISSYKNKQEESITTSNDKKYVPDNNGGFTTFTVDDISISYDDISAKDDYDNLLDTYVRDCNISREWLVNRFDEIIQAHKDEEISKCIISISKRTNKVKTTEELDDVIDSCF